MDNTERVMREQLRIKIAEVLEIDFKGKWGILPDWTTCKGAALSLFDEFYGRWNLECEPNMSGSGGCAGFHYEVTIGFLYEDGFKVQDNNPCLALCRAWLRAKTGVRYELTDTQSTLEATTPT